MTTYSITDLGSLLGQCPLSEAINESGVVTGTLDDYQHVFRYKDYTFAQLDTTPPFKRPGTSTTVGSSPNPSTGRSGAIPTSLA